MNVTDEQLAIIMEYLWKNDVPLERVKLAAEAWYRIKGKQTSGVAE